MYEIHQVSSPPEVSSDSTDSSENNEETHQGNSTPQTASDYLDIAVGRANETSFPARVTRRSLARAAVTEQSCSVSEM